MHTSTHDRFPTREDAGHALAERLARFINMPEGVVLALPKGGVAVGTVVARDLHLAFDVLVIGRITMPGCGDTPLGAITSGGVRMLNCALIDRLHLSDRDVREAVLRKSLELAERERAYRNHRPSVDVADRKVIIVDDGSSACSVLRSAVRLLRRQHADEIVVAVPVACHNAACDLRMEADEVVALVEPAAASSAGKWFEHFEAPSQDEVRRMVLSMPLQPSFAC